MLFVRCFWRKKLLLSDIVVGTREKAQSKAQFIYARQHLQ